MGKVEYTRIINPSTILEFSAGFFNSVETGPPEDDKALAGIQRATYPQLNRLGQFASRNNPLGLIPRVQFGNVPSADRAMSNDGGTPQITYDGRWPITGNDIAAPVSINLTHTRGRHTYKAGVLRDDELFGQARSGTFGGEFNFQDDANDPGRTGYAFANAAIGHVRSYLESLGRVPDDRRQKTWAWFVQDTWKIHPKVTLDLGLRMYKWGPPLAMAGEGSGFTFERFDPAWGGNPPVFFRPILVGTQRRAQNPRTGQILPATYIGLIVPGTGYTCSVITPDTPCKINGIVTQDDGNYLENGDRGFTEPSPLQYDPRFGVAWAINPRTAVRISGGSFHDSSAGLYLQQGGGNVAYRYDNQVFFTDFDSYLTGSSATSPVPNTTGVVRTDTKRPNNLRFTAGIQRELGKNIVLDAAYVGSRTKHVLEVWNFNQLPAGVRFRPESRDTTVTPTAANPGALPDPFLRPYLGFSDINIASSSGSQTYDSLQVGLTRRFTGRFEMAGSYTWAVGDEHNLRQNNPLPSTTDRRDIQEHVLVVSYQYELPGGSALFKGHGAAKAILDNWRISGISTFATGGRGDITASYSPDFDYTGGGEICGGVSPNPTGFRTRGLDGTYGAGDIGQRPYNVVGDIELSGGDRSIDRWFNTDAVKPAKGVGDVGNDCRAWKFTMPGFRNHDLSFFKDFKLKGTQTLQYRWEIYNLLNGVSFQTVNTAATFNPTTGAQTNPNFGKVTAARNERRMQMSLRYIF
jgi:hypothetical protein